MNIFFQVLSGLVNTNSISRRKEKVEDLEGQLKTYILLNMNHV